MANNASTRSSNGRTGNRIVSATPLASRAYGGGSNTAILSRVRWAFMPPANDNRRPLIRTIHLALSRVILPAAIIGLIFYWQFG